MRTILPELNQRVSAALSLAAGALTPLAFAPFDAWPCAILGPALLLLALGEANPRVAVLRGWLFGVGFYGTGVSWVYVSIHEFGYAPAWLAAGLTGLFIMGLALMPAGLCWAWRRWFSMTPATLLIGFPGLWIITEWVRYWLLSGFPWNYLGYAYLDTPLAGWAPLGGVYALSWMSVSTAGALVVLLGRNLPAWPRAAALLLMALTWLGGWQLNRMEWTTPLAHAPVRVALVQGNIAQDVKWQPSQVAPTLRVYEELTQQHWNADLVIWPEAAIPIFLHEAQPWLDQLSQLADQTGTGIITGIPYWGINPAHPAEPILHNSITGFGAATGLYHKRKLVPFGEYVPFDAVLRGVIRFLDLPMSNFARGGTQQQGLYLQHAGRELRLAPYICYEIVYPDFVARTYGGADLLVTISNDAWFGASTGPAQHLQIARMRALELGREILRGTNNGLTAIIDTRGHVRALAPRFETAVLTGEVRAYEGQTPFSRWGSGAALVLGLILTLLTRRIRKPGENAA